MTDCYVIAGFGHTGTGIPETKYAQRRALLKAIFIGQMNVLHSRNH
jgi:hypothetical protein